MKPHLPTSISRRWHGFTPRRIVLAVVAIAILAFVWRGLAPSLATASFGFLFNATNWDMGFSVLPYSSRDPYWWALLVGLSNTLGAGVLAIIGATALGFAVGVARSSGNMLLGDIGRIYADFIRNVPLILQAMFWYAVILHFPPPRAAHQVLSAIYLSNRGLYLPIFADVAAAMAGVALAALLAWGSWASLRGWRQRRAAEKLTRPAVIGFGLCLVAIIGLAMLAPRLIGAFAIDWPVLTGLNFRGGARIPPEFAALAIAVTIYRGAFISEVFRGGFASVSPGQIDAAKSLGLKPWMVLFRIRLPLALIAIVPPLSSEYMIIIKVTSIGIVVGFWDLFAVSSHSANLTGRSLEVLFVMVVIYLVLNYALSVIMNLANRRVLARGFDANA